MPTCPRQAMRGLAIPYASGTPAQRLLGRVASTVRVYDIANELARHVPVSCTHRVLYRLSADRACL